MNARMAPRNARERRLTDVLVTISKERAFFDAKVD